MNREANNHKLKGKNSFEPAFVRLKGRKQIEGGSSMSRNGEVQRNDQQYQMPNALRQKKDFVYRVGYTATTGNDTGGKDEPGKRTDLEG